MNTTTPATAPILTAAILRAAAAAAIALAMTVDDGGSCNFDSPVLYAPKRQGKKWQAIVAEAGGDSFVWRGIGGGGLVLSFGFPGQAHRRTVAATEMERLLKAQGFETSMYYAMD